MNTLRNNVQLIGHLGMKPEITTLESGQNLAKFSIATNEVYKNKQGEKIENTDWHNIVCWNKTADIAAMFLDKGKQIALTGKLSTRSYEDKNGEKKYFTEVIANEILMLGKK